MRIDMSNKTMSMSSIEDREVIDLTMSPEVNEKQEITSRKGAPVKSTKRVTFVNLAGDEGDNNDELTLLRSSNIVNFIPFDNTYSYEINKKIPSGESYYTYFKGIISNGFVSGDVDFIINNSFNFRSVSVGCCE